MAFHFDNALRDALLFDHLKPAIVFYLFDIIDIIEYNQKQVWQ